MATHLGKEGYLKVSTTTVGEIRDYTLSQSAGTVDTTVIGDDWTTNKVTQKSWTCSGSLFWDEADAGQLALTIGSAVTLNLYPEGIAGSSTYYTGGAYITQFDVTGRFDSMVEATFSAQGNGECTVTTV